MLRSFKLVIFGLLVVILGFGFINAKDRSPEIQPAGVYDFDKGVEIVVPVDYVEMYPAEIVVILESDQPKCNVDLIEVIKSEVEAVCC
ncbi:MAG TPA: hypothetical protein PKG52_10250 [bacterium]|nr:hypothetical protein [bacterium]HPS30256.1 hypothetical protein [bacterium]